MVMDSKKYLFTFLLFGIIEWTLAKYYLHAQRLHDDLLHKKGYNSFVRPVKNSSEVISVKIGIRLTQIIDVDEQNQMMTTNLWVTQEWTDRSLIWDPGDYDNVTEIYVPAQSIWNPEIVLFNNADGNYLLTVASKANVAYNGYVKWHPPAAIKTSCEINVKYFPFDVQTCTLQFGSWTYSTEEVVLVHNNRDPDPEDPNPNKVIPGIDFTAFYASVEWDLMDAWANRSSIHLAGSEEWFEQWTFAIVLRRKFLFYITNLIIPLVAHAFVTVLVFYLPSESKEKISLCINILLSLTVYFLMLAEVIPPTSIVVPLMAEYLLFTLILVTSSVIITTLTLNVHFRTSASHVMPDWVRKVFLYFLPRILRMKRPKVENSQDIALKHIKLNLCTCLDGGNIRRNDSAFKYQFGSKRTHTQVELYKLSKALDEETYFRKNLNKQYTAEVADAIEGAIFIANHLKGEDEFKRTKEDWKYVAQVVDRIFLIIYSFVCIAGTVGVILKAPSLYDKRLPMKVSKFE